MRTEERRAREIVAQRSQGLCDGCLTSRGTDWAHRVARSRGGRWSASNGLLLCRAQHAWQHDHPVDAQRLGWTVRTGIDPAEVPCWTARHGWALLRPDGGLARCGQEGEMTGAWDAWVM